jgi:hypothetical protein
MRSVFTPIRKPAQARRVSILGRTLMPGLVVRMADMAVVCVIIALAQPLEIWL